MLILKRLILKLERKKEKEVFESGKHAADSDHGNDFFFLNIAMSLSL